MGESCFACGAIIDDDDRLVLVRRSRHDIHCSDSCLRVTVRRHRAAVGAARRRWFLGAWLAILIAAGIGTLWRRHRAAPPEWIASVTPELAIVVEEEPPRGPIYFGPNWPPTDAEWMEAFDKASWLFPLPGPARRACATDGRFFGPEPARHQPPPACRQEGLCGVDVGGELWGEHVYAALDGVVDRVQRASTDERGGQYVRLSHFGGMVFTQYFHLAATPRRMFAGARVRAGEVIGLLGDTGLKGARRHLHFALSVRPSLRSSEIYWDPRPWIGGAAVRLPPNGTVAGLASPERKGPTPRHRRSK